MLACFERLRFGFVDVSAFSMGLPCVCRILRIGILRNAVKSLDVRDAKASSRADEASP